MDHKELLKRVDHTLLTPTAAWDQIQKLCDEGLTFGTASICIPPRYVSRAAGYVGQRLKICTVVGFPNGYNTPEVKVFETEDAIRNGACIVTDTQMAKAGINKRALARYGGEAYCFMSDEDVAALAKKNGTTRATASMDKAAEMDKKLIFAIGNAPTALVRLYELIENGKLSPELIIGVPVGFVNVVQSKELIMHADVPYIVAKGRKGGSNIAACIVNALLYMIDNRRD